MTSNDAIEHPGGEPMIAGEDYYLGQRIPRHQVSYEEIPRDTTSRGIFYAPHTA
ncbi:hypothetical protein [Gordonia sp. MMO-8]|uniref:hypothetical protein n=1 Tax=Gordonia sp. MMO-8 TaxID=3127886 RepID=UPI00301AFF5E